MPSELETSALDGWSVPPRPRRGQKPIEHDSEPLHEVWWRGRQWAVTAYGVERLDGTYAIEAGRLGQEMASGDPPDAMLLTHVSREAWVDSDDLATAWLVAMAMHGVHAPADTVRQAVAAMHPQREAGGAEDSLLAPTRRRGWRLLEPGWRRRGTIGGGEKDRQRVEETALPPTARP